MTLLEHAASGHRSAFFFNDGAYGYDFGPQHPLRPIRLRALVELVEGLGWFDDAHSRRVAPAATRDELMLVHERGYVETVEALSKASYPLADPDEVLARRRGLGQGDTPAFAGMHQSSAEIAGATLAAVRAVVHADVDHAFSPSGGLHHAMAAHASGFCIYNDPAIAIAAALRDGIERVLYVDFDAHHGDGVQAAFYDNPHVLKLSFHESGRYLFPGSGEADERGEGAGEGFSVNVPLQPYTDDDRWLAAVEASLPELCRAYAPELIVSQHGCDGHVWDPLTHLSLTLRAFRRQTGLVHALAHEVSCGRWVACGGGGYQPLRVVPRAWAAVWAEMCGFQLPETLPSIWLARWSPLSAEPIPNSFAGP